MSSPATTAARIEAETHTELPESYNGWKRYRRNSETVEYWRARSTHVSGQYERLALRVTSDTYTLSKTSYDQFGHNVGQTQILSGTFRGDVEFLWGRLQKQMDEHDGHGEFTSPPELESVGCWELVERRHEGSNRNTVQWEADHGTLLVEEVAIRDLYRRTKREFDVRYIDSQESTKLVGSIPRTAAFEVATFVMERLNKSPKESCKRRSRLQQLTDIGPARSHRLLQLGIRDRDELRECVVEANPCNYHHSEEVKKLVTKRLKSQLK